MSVREVCIPSSTKQSLSLTIHQDRDAGHGGLIWDAELCLAHYVWNELPCTSHGGERAIELGAGTGIAGLTLASKGYQVLLTDKPALVPLLELNAEANRRIIENDAGHGSAVLASTFLFGASRKRLPREFQPEASDLAYVIASDILGCGDEGMFDDILKTFKDLTTRSNVLISSERSCLDKTEHTMRSSRKVLMSYKFRGNFENKFFDKAAETFLIRTISIYSKDRRGSLALLSNETWDADVHVFELTPR
eukprot:gb/GECG01006824.1/.p1 GENE.gb/GECG01006824.1/~~gb/GECG01006824.1/.p1  ORF type:complete len:250 (+),score=28.30 gb/GECG01006824.1/:1-750(+)